jgi:hypothetical protein
LAINTRRNAVSFLSHDGKESYCQTECVSATIGDNGSKT